MITKAIALSLRHGQILYDGTYTNADGTPRRVRVNGAVKTWKTRPTHFRVPVKYGLSAHGHIDHINGEYWYVDETAAQNAS